MLTRVSESLNYLRKIVRSKECPGVPPFKAILSKVFSPKM